MKKTSLIGFLVLATFLTGCTSAPATNLPPQIEIQEGVLPEVPEGKDEKLFYATLSKEWIEKKHDLNESIELYKKLIQLFPRNSAPRKEMLGYIMNEDLHMIIRDRKAQEGLEIALKLDKLIPLDFYVQNRIIAAYRIMAEDEIAKKNYQAAEEILKKKALSIRFDQEAVRTLIKLRLIQVKEALAQNNQQQARTYLEEVYLYTGVEENILLYKEERKEAETLAEKLK